MGWTRGDDEEDSSNSDGGGTDGENNSDDGTENTLDNYSSDVDKREDDQLALPQSTDKSALWKKIYNDTDLQDILNGLDSMEGNEPAKSAGESQAESSGQQGEHLIKELQKKEDQYRPDIKACIKQQFINTVMERAKITTLSKTLFILKIILKEAPGQITGSYEKTPLLHHIINLEAEGSQEKGKKNNKNPFWGFTSQLCKLVADTHLSEAIVKTNKKGENCLHLIVRHMDNIRDPSSMISSLAPGSTAFTQKRSEDGNTPLHDALHFSKVARRIVPCRDNQGSKSSRPTKTMKQGGNILCHECDMASQANRKLPPFSAYRGIIEKLVAACPDVLKEHNHAGQPPYLYHLDTRRYRNEDIKKLPRCSPRNSEADASGHKAVDRSTTDQFPGPRPSRQDTGRIDKPLGNQKNVNNPKSQDAQAQEHGYDTRNSSQLVKDLEKHIHAMSWGYADMIRCFFWGRNTHGAGTKLPKIYLKQDFRLPTRVSANTSSSYNFFKFESRLALVSLSLQPDDSYKVEERDEIGENDAANMIEVFRWLREDKGVTKILKLVVKDNPKRYCSEETIEKCLGYMKEIRFLNWDRPDLSVTTLTKAKRLIEVCLYSSGINAVLHHWSDQNGLVTLSKLKKVSLRAERGLETSQQSERNIEGFQKRLEEQCKRNVDNQQRRRDDKDPTNNEDGDSQQPRHIKVEVDKSEMVNLETQPSGKSCSEHHRSKLLKSAGFKAAQKFSTGLKNYMTGASGSHPNERKIKIALLDDGVNPEYDGLGHFFAGTGHPQSSLEPEVEDGALFYSSTKGHGNKMAWIISSICPFVEFYVAKIDSQEDRGDLPRLTFDASQAATALEWALAQDVDIISMSWNFMATESVEVQAAVKKMKELLYNDQSRTLLFCAARDDKGTKAVFVTALRFWP